MHNPSPPSPSTETSKFGEAEMSLKANAFPGWENFVPHFVHPVKVAIVEALLCTGEPLSAPQLGMLFRGAGTKFSESNVRFHLARLVEIGMLMITPIELSGKSVYENFYYFSDG
jgi:hypothetical protein